MHCIQGLFWFNLDLFVSHGFLRAFSQFLELWAVEMWLWMWISIKVNSRIAIMFRWWFIIFKTLQEVSLETPCCTSLELIIIDRGIANRTSVWNFRVISFFAVASLDILISITNIYNIVIWWSRSFLMFDNFTQTEWW